MIKVEEKHFPCSSPLHISMLVLVLGNIYSNYSKKPQQAAEVNDSMFL